MISLRKEISMETSINPQMLEQFRTDGYVNVSGLFSEEEAGQLLDHYMQIWEGNDYPNAPSKQDLQGDDPLKRYPRIMQPHRWDPTSLQWMLDDRLRQAMTALLGTEPYAVQTMLYFKPAGAKGQALHQDQFYLRVQPGTCLAAWMALDPCDEENGCLQVVPGTQDLPVLCTIEADTTQSFTDVTVPLPEGYEPVPVRMRPGDVLFFNGQLVHGSFPNSSEERFRRSLIGHYIVGEAEKVAQWYHPVMRMDGSVVELDISERGGPCGIWVDQDGKVVVEMEESAPAVQVAGRH
jgi:phytanoyl-CoA hydroxylase